MGLMSLLLNNTNNNINNNTNNNNMTLQQQLDQHKLELINKQAQMYELGIRINELKCIVQALDLGVQKEVELTPKPKQEE